MKHGAHLGPSRTRRGFTLIEMMIGAVILAMLVGSMGVVVLSARGVYEQGLSSAALEARGRRTLQRISNELTGAIVELTTVPAANAEGPAIAFQTCTGYTAGAMTKSSVTRIELRPEPGDPDDGIDNDHDGSIDEKQIVLVRNAGQANQIESVLCGGVRELLQGETANMADDNGNGLIDEGGLSFARDAHGTITIRLTLEARDPHGLLVARTVEGAVHMRNHNP
jgi:prepilin-type N-terminal cleavage/methylation domain-containing protein